MLPDFNTMFGDEHHQPADWHSSRSDPFFIRVMRDGLLRPKIQSNRNRHREAGRASRRVDSALMEVTLS